MPGSPDPEQQSSIKQMHGEIQFGVLRNKAVV